LRGGTAGIASTRSSPGVPVGSLGRFGIGTTLCLDPRPRPLHGHRRCPTKGCGGEGYNFGGHQEIKNIDLRLTLLELLAKLHSLIDYVKDRPGHDLRYAIDCSRAVRDLGWKPQVDFRRGIRETIDWYLGHSEWVRRVRSGDYLKYYEE